MKQLIAFLLPLALFAQPQSPNFIMGRETLSAVASRDSTQEFVLYSTVGQLSDIGTFTSPNYIVEGGFLSSVFQTQVPGLSVDRDTVEFGDVWINTAAQDSILVTNTGNAVLVVDSVHSDHPLIQSVTVPAMIPAGQSLATTWQVSPPDTLTYSGNLFFITNAGTDSVYVTVHGIWTELRVDPASVDFGIIAVGDSLDSVLTFRNVGNTELQITSANFGSGYFSLIGPALSTIVAYESIERTVRFRAETSGIFLDTLVLVNSVGPDVRVLLAAGATATEDRAEIPGEFTLGQNYPNPFNPLTRVPFAAPVEGKVRIQVYDVLGQTVAVLLDSRLSAGYYETSWNGTSFPSGIYFVRMTAADFVATRKLLLLK